MIFSHIHRIILALSGAPMPIIDVENYIGHFAAQKRHTRSL